jgi:tetraacyldisaccharide-1-P 4'-kinase
VVSAFKADIPLFRCTHRPELVTRIRAQAFLPGDLKQIQDRFDPPFLKGKKVVAFSGIGDNRHFFDMLHHLGCTVTDFLAFSDHHPYTNADIEEIFQKAGHAGVDALVTTEKDYVRIAEKRRCPVNLLVLGVGISFEQEEVRFTSFLKERIAGPPGWTRQ